MAGPSSTAFPPGDTGSAFSIRCRREPLTRIRKTKTDPIDSQGIAQLIRFGRFAAAIIRNERALRIRELARYRIVVVHLLNQFTNLLESRVSRTFPEFGSTFRSCSFRRPWESF